MSYHSNTPANRAAVNQENLIRQVAVILRLAILELGQLTSNFCRDQRPGYSSWGENQP